MNEGTTFEPKSERWTFIALLFSGLALIPVYFIGIQNRNIHWDEFYYLAVVHRYLAGSLSASFQTLHVHFFWWLPSVANPNHSCAFCKLRPVCLHVHWRLANRTQLF